MGIDPTEGPEVLAAYREAQGYPWEVFISDREVLERYNVISTAIKYAIDRRGVITFKGGYGVVPADTWEQVFDELLES